MLNLKRYFGVLGFGALLSSSAWAGTPYAVGQVFAAVGNGQVKVFSPTGTLIQTLNDGTSSTYTTGMVFDAAGNLFVTNFSLGSVSKFDPSGNLLGGTFFTTTGMASPESIVVDATGNFYVGGPSAAKILKFTPAGGTPTTTFTVAGGNGTGGTDWMDLMADQHTMLYDGEGTELLSYNVATSTQNAVFSNAAAGDIYAFRIIPSGTFAGNVLTSDSANALMLSSTGAIVKTYTLPGNAGGDFALNLDPNGVDFWTSDSSSGNIWAVNIATGAIDHQFLSGAPGLTFGLTVFGQITAGGGGGSGPPTTPAPKSLLLTLIGLTALGLWQLGRRFGSRTV